MLKEEVAGQSEALKISEAYQDAPPDSPESFLYSNAIQSCEDLFSDFKKRLWIKVFQAAGLMSLMLLSSSLFFFLRIRKGPSQP
jgi:hypothetical protein